MVAPLSTPVLPLFPFKAFLKVLEARGCSTAREGARVAECLFNLCIPVRRRPRPPASDRGRVIPRALTEVFVAPLVEAVALKREAGGHRRL